MAIIRRPSSTPRPPAPLDTAPVAATSTPAWVARELAVQAAEARVIPPTAVVQAKPITELPNQANSALGIFGITGSGKTSQIKLGAEEAWEVYHKITLLYASDLGGYGNALLSLIRLGIIRVWYIRNHVNPLETMDAASRGDWPEHIEDIETGYAPPTVKLVPVRRTTWTMLCPNGHPVGSYHAQDQVTMAHAACPTCGQITTATNTQGITKQIVRPGLFKDVGMRAYDSMQQMCEWGQIALRDKSARGELPAGGSGGAALGSADAVREMTSHTSREAFVAGTGSKAHYGFMQDSVPVWLANIRSIPDQVLPPICTFGVEYGKGSDESGGIPMFGPKISGNARTANVPGWLGNCLYAAKEPHNPPETDEHGNVRLYHRLWLTNHVDSRDQGATTIVAKHRGEPLGMPPYLEDSGDPEHAWEQCSLRVFFKLLRDQFVQIEARDKAKYPNAPGLVVGSEDEVVEQGQAGDMAPAVPVPMGGRKVVGRRGKVQQGPTVESSPNIVVDEPSLGAPLTGGTEFEGSPGKLAAGPSSGPSQQLPAEGRPQSALTPEQRAPATFAAGEVDNIVAELKAAPEPPSVIEQQLRATLEASAQASSVGSRSTTDNGKGAVAPPPPMSAQSRVVRRPRPPTA